MGFVLILAGVVVNEWVLTAFWAADGEVAMAGFFWSIRAFQVLCFVTGGLMVRGRWPGSAGRRRFIGAVLILGVIMLNHQVLAAFVLPYQKMRAWGLVGFVTGAQIGCVTVGLLLLWRPQRVVACLQRNLRLAGERLPVAVIVLVFALVAGGGLRLGAISAKNWITHDEAISYLASTGHQGEYENLVEKEEPPFGAWVEAGRWQRLWTIEERLPLGRIGRDLAHHDIHPPLYFWLLHAFALLVGVEMWTGPLLNVLVFSATAPAVFGLGRYALGSDRQAALATVLWAVSPALQQITLQARPYELLGLFSVLYVWLAAKCLQEPEADVGAGWHQHVFLGIVVAGGLLTHYHFALLLGATAAFMAVRCIQGRGRFLWGTALAMTAGTVVFVLIHPGFWRSFLLAQRQAQSLSLDGLRARTVTVGSVLLEFVVPPRLGGRIPLWVVGLVGVGLAVRYLRWRRIRASVSGFLERRCGRVLFIFCGCFAGIVLLYLTFVSPAHAMRPRYLSLIWPCVALMAVMLVHKWSGGRLYALAGLCVLMVVSGWLHVLYQLPHTPNRFHPMRMRSRPVLIDNTDRGVLPRIMWHLRPDRPVYAASQAHLLENSEAWLSHPGSSADYVSWLRHDSTEEGRSRILELVEDRYVVHRVSPPWSRRRVRFELHAEEGDGDGDGDG